MMARMPISRRPHHDLDRDAREEPLGMESVVKS